LISRNKADKDVKGLYFDFIGINLTKF